MTQEDKVKLYAERIKNDIMGFALAAHKGHILCHCNIAYDLLKNDVLYGVNNDGTKRYSSTSFYSEKEAEEYIRSMILDASEIIAKWLLDDSKGGTLHIRKYHKSSIGYGYSSFKWHDWKKGPFDCYVTNVFLGKDYLKDGTPYYFIKTAYPSERKNTSI